MVRLSVVVVAYDMARELPRTLATLGPSYQRGIDPSDYEVIVVDNGSPEPVDAAMVARCAPNARLIRLDPAPPSPARAANEGVAEAAGALVGLIVDGARMASPGLLAGALTGARCVDDPVVATLGWHLGSAPHGTAEGAAHDQEAEDELLASIDWAHDGYLLFGISCFASSSARGWFGPMGETSALFLTPERWRALDGLDEAFDLPGGGLVNHDLYRRAVTSPGAEVVVLLGEGTFHQFHGGAATSGLHRWEAMQEQYAVLRGASYRPAEVDPLFVGHVPVEALAHVGRSVELAARRRARRGPGRPLSGSA